MIFISYRRDDSAFFAGRLVDRLIEWFGRGLVFQDIHSIHAGEDFADAITSTIRRSRVVLVVIGPNWLKTALDGRRIDDPRDVVRIEVETALASQPHTHVVPVYLDKECVLTLDSLLPVSMQQLLTKSGLLVRPGAEFNDDVRRLAVEVLRYLFPTMASRVRHRLIHHLRKSRRGITLAMLSSVAIFLGRDFISSQVLLTDSGLPASVARLDSNAFYSTRPDATVELARGFASRDALIAHTDLARAISDTTRTLDVYSIAATAFITQHEALERALDRGARVRFLLVDQADENLEHLQPFLKSRGRIDITAAESKVKLALSISRLNVLQRRALVSGKGTLEIRTWKEIYWNSMWVRDSEDPNNRLAHIEIGYFGDSKFNPSVRFGRLGPEMVRSVQDQFDLMWRLSIESALSR